LDWHIIAADEVLQRLSASEKAGLDEAQVHRKRGMYGTNVFSPPPNRMFRKILGWIFGGFGSLLFVGSIICFVAWCVPITADLHHSHLTPSTRKPLGEPAPQVANLALAIVILIVIVFQAVFNAWQDFSMSSVMKSIKSMLPSEVQTLRDGKYVSLLAADLVVGDIVQIQLGQQVPADLRIISTSGDLQFDRSVLTGEVYFFSPLIALAFSDSIPE
jgi:sodium/potassium-transporting ATPase subunit alpha